MVGLLPVDRAEGSFSARAIYSKLQSSRNMPMVVAELTECGPPAHPAALSSVRRRDIG